jgi:hypothetical protein
MPYALFHDYFPEIAEKETRGLTIQGKSPWGLPPGNYGLLEMFCDERGCDCRRVFFYVVSQRTNDVVAVVGYGWESPDFYIKWLRDDDPEMIRDLMGPSLNLMSPQSKLAPAILEMVRDALRDEAYVERIKGHYKMFRQV